VISGKAYECRLVCTLSKRDLQSLDLIIICRKLATHYNYSVHLDRGPSSYDFGRCVLSTRCNLIAYIRCKEVARFIFLPLVMRKLLNLSCYLAVTFGCLMLNQIGVANMEQRLAPIHVHPETVLSTNENMSFQGKSN